MTTVLIADQSKSSLVMTAEVFKDRLPGTIICITKTGLECLEISKTQKFDMIVVDFELPDTDAVTLTKLLREHYKGPIVITAMPEKIVDQAINDELFGYHDSACWVRKPVKFDRMSEVIETFLIEKQRLLKRYETEFQAMVPGKTQKSPPKVTGNVINMSVGGALLTLKDQAKLKKGEAITLKIDLSPKTTQTKTSKKVQKPTPEKRETLVKARVAWTNRKQVGICFEPLTEPQKKVIEDVLRASKELS